MAAHLHTHFCSRKQRPSPKVNTVILESAGHRGRICFYFTYSLNVLPVAGVLEVLMHPLRMSGVCYTKLTDFRISHSKAVVEMNLKPWSWGMCR